jgi:NAD(P)-dependent dehydrogenase (short-subunit alcohol dehydrogenase family)
MTTAPYPRPRPPERPAPRRVAAIGHDARVGASAIVTGGASGLGAATAARLERDGFGVVRMDLASGGGVVAGDVTREDDLQAAVDAARATGPLRVAVACAGVAAVGRTLARDGTPYALDAFRRVLDVNLVGSFNLLRLAAAAMAPNPPDDEGQRGVVVLTASVAAFDGQIGQVAYAASKGGVVGMVLPAARDLAAIGVRVIAIAPGTFDTPLLAGLPEAARASLAAAVPNPARLGRPEEYADLVAHIVANVMLNGETIRLDGALRMAPR